MSILIGIDIGTTTIKALAFDVERAEAVAIAARPTPVDHPQPGWSQHDPIALWRTVAACLREVVGQCRAAEIAGLGVSSFAEAGVPLDARGEALYPVIAWYDRRSEPQAAWWEAQLSAPELHAITGQRVSPSFGVNKWLWIRENEPERAARMAHWLSVPDYILWRLTGERATDYTIASRTLLFDQRAQAWSDEMLRRAGLRREQLPRPLAGGTVVGRVTAQAAEETGLPAGMPCALGGHDHLVAAVAAGGYRPGTVIDSSGTAQAVLMFLSDFHTNEAMAASGYACYSHVLPGTYVLKAGLKLAGGAVEWLARQLSSAGTPADELPYLGLLAQAEQSVGQQAGPVWLPHLIGSGTPQGDRHSRAALVGLTAEHGQGDIFRALLESLAFWLRHNLSEASDLSGQPVREVILLGGTKRLELLSRLKATALNQPVAVLDIPEAAATGAALLAGIGSGVFDGPAEAVRNFQENRVVISPDAELVDWYDRLYHEAYLPLYGLLRDVNHGLAAMNSLSHSQETT